jgi:hypothetical protein
MVAIAVALIVAACSPGVGDSLPSDGPLELPSAGGATRVVTLFAESDSRDRAIGNIRAANTGEDVITITKVELVDPVNVRLGESVLIPLTSDMGTLGAGYPVPPVRTDAEFDRLNTLWKQSEPLLGSHIEPGQVVNLVVGLVQIDKSKCASLASTTFEYTASGKKFQASWDSNYRLTKLDGTECPAAP